MLNSQKCAFVLIHPGVCVETGAMQPVWVYASLIHRKQSIPSHLLNRVNSFRVITGGRSKCSPSGTINKSLYI